ncbi:UDP-N-acetylmuramoyl-L-alanyl-D-glutamate--2,6-diaminopimelate ligase [Dermabacteraceae bacterium TAE3-ERU27]|nr:UDP-N-acetylmuramoyl-L-alanyl-D-glutamate--2,6-diaminopimelate ligase [Dermabacteraceae bacterium TAE3-ERU27]
MARQMRPENTAGVASTELAALLGAKHVGEEVQLHGCTLDSRLVLPGDLFCALPGARAHGADFSAQVAQAGASAALTDQAGLESVRAAGLSALVCADPRAVMALAAAKIYGYAGSKLRCVGVTGTNGKTSVTTMLVGALRELGKSCAVVGTNGTFYDRDGETVRIPTVRTTPESPDVQAMLARFAASGIDTAAFEVSSHALVLHRVDELRFDAVCFMNLSQDHLDFHSDMEDYFQAKASLFTPERAAAGVICVDDEWGTRLAEQSQIEAITFATREGIAADYTVSDIEVLPTGHRVRLNSHKTGETVSLVCPIPGRHYIANAVAVTLLAHLGGEPLAKAAEAVGRAATVPGRMEVVASAPVRGVVDYAHTEAALRSALEALRHHSDGGKIITVMGAGGDRDRTKRPLMGAAAAELSDLVVVTDDNPRSEDPAQIRSAVMTGIPAQERTRVSEVPSRAEAIRHAVSLAQPGDTVLVAGKGSETGQDVAGTVHPFDDRVELRKALGQKW